MVRRLLASRPDHATVIAYLALFCALGLGTAWAATELQKGDVTSKIIKDGAVKGKDLAKNLVKGAVGPQGKPGQDATHLYAYIRDNGDGVAASVAYGNGVIGVTETAFPGEYAVQFDRSVSNCVAHATSGEGDPHGATATTDSGAAAIYMQTGPPEEIEIVFEDDLGNDSDTSFLVSAVC